MATLFGQASTPTRRGGSTLFGGTSSGDDLDRLRRSIENAEMRIQDAGFDVQNADRRNWFERATNLPQGQNVFFDTLELLGRPGQALLNPVQSALQGSSDTALQSAWKGFSGQNTVRGSDIAEELGVNSGVGKFAAGLGIEVLTDPLNVVPAGKVGQLLGSAAKGVGNVGKRGYLTLENMVPKLEEIRTQVVAPRVRSVKDSLGYMFNPEYKQTETLFGGQSDALQRAYRTTENQRRYLTEEYTDRLLNTAREAGLEAGPQVGRVMEAPLRQFEEVKGYEFPDGVRRTTDKAELFAERASNQQLIKEIGQRVRATRREIDTQISATAKRFDKLDRDIQKMFFSLENKKMKSLQRTDPKILEKKTGLKKFAPNSPALNLLMRQSDELQDEIAKVRQELGLPKVRKKSYTQEQMQKLATERTFKQLSGSPAFNVLIKQRDEMKSTLDELREVRKTSLQESIKEIQKLVGENEALKEAARNPVMIQQEIQRVAREMPTDPKINAAAQELIQSNAEIRELAERVGIPINELEGYMTHVWSKETRNAKKAEKRFLDPLGGRGGPSKKLLEQRKLMGSVEDINERLGKNFFEPNAFFASAIGQRRLIDYIHSVAFRKEVLNNPDFAIPYEQFKALGQPLPENAVVINSNNYKFIRESGDILEGVANKDIGGEYVVTKAAKLLLDRYQKAASDEGTRQFLKAYDAMQSIWKRAALFSVGYHVRNDIGAKFNNWVGGMNLVDIGKYSALAQREVFNAMARGKQSDLYREFRQQGLGATSQAAVEFARRGQEPEDAIQKLVEQQSKSAGRRAVDMAKPWNWFDTSQKLGAFIDQTNRFALYKWARDKGLSPEEAAKKVRQIQFDYTNTTQFERDVMTRAFPFYRWIRNNLPFQIMQFIKDPRKYTNLNKVRLNAQDAAGIEDEKVPKYMKEGFYIPVSSDKMLGFNLPLGDLGKISDPLKMGTDSLTPLLKLPLELSTNFNFFYRKPIEKFAGQEKQFTLFGQDLGGIPMKDAYALEQMTGQIGRGLSGYLTKEESIDQDTKFRLPSLGISSILKDFDVEKATMYELYDRLNRLQDYIDYIEQQTGTRPRTVNEIGTGETKGSTLFGS